jgi:hypothetical protein
LASGCDRHAPRTPKTQPMGRATTPVPPPFSSTKPNKELVGRFHDVSDKPGLAPTTQSTGSTASWPSWARDQSTCRRRSPASPTRSFPPSPFRAN